MSILSPHFAPFSRARMAVLAMLLLFVPVALASASAAETVAPDPLVVFLVRHAEKVDNSHDPRLSSAGRRRAAELAGLLRDAGIQYVHSTDFIRTRETARPTAKGLGLEVEMYEPGERAALAKQMKQSGGRHLVVGHSNTTPAVVELLGGEPGEEIDELSEYDRLYIVTIGADGAASTVLMRYGKLFSSRSR